jgi:hypothetical protein
MEVRDEIERAFAFVLQNNVPDVVMSGLPVETGTEVADRPMNFIGVACAEAEHKAGGVYLVDVEVTVVIEMDRPDAVSYAATRFGEIVRWIEDPACLLRGYEDTTLRVFGYHVSGQEEEKGSRQIVQRLFLKVGAASL